MNSERDLIARIEAADVPMLAQLLQRPTRQDEEVLRTYFGDGRYRSMRSLALQTTQRRATTGTRGNVVVLHGIMGGELTRVPAVRSHNRNVRPCSESMHQAMHAARIAIGHKGGRTWGAYQHYGNPNFRLFDEESFDQNPDE